MNTQTTTKIIDRIQKLLELGESDNPNEAKLAIEKASSLMRDHCISEAMLNKENPKEINISYSDYYLPDRGAPWTRELFSGVVKAFHCRVIYCPYFLEKDSRCRYYGRYFGTEGDQATVKLMMDFAISSTTRIMNRERNLIQSMQKTISTPFRSYINSFQKGIARGMRQTLNGIANQNYKDKNPTSSTPSSYGLVLIKTEVKVDSAFKAMYPRTSSLGGSSASSSSGFSSGREQGSKVGFNSQVSNSKRGYLK